LVKEVMDFSCEDGSGIDIVKLVVFDFAHRISVVHASINTKRCKTCRYKIYDMKNELSTRKEFDEYLLAVYMEIAIINLIESGEAVNLFYLLVSPGLGFQGKSMCTCDVVYYFVYACVRSLIYLSLTISRIISF
jgi:hypothetical protein